MATVFAVWVRVKSRHQGNSVRHLSLFIQKSIHGHALSCLMITLTHITTTYHGLHAGRARGGYFALELSTMLEAPCLGLWMFGATNGGLTKKVTNQYLSPMSQGLISFGLAAVA